MCTCGAVLSFMCTIRSILFSDAFTFNIHATTATCLMMQTYCRIEHSRKNSRAVHLSENILGHFCKALHPLLSCVWHAYCSQKVSVCSEGSAHQAVPEESVPLPRYTEFQHSREYRAADRVNRPKRALLALWQKIKEPIMSEHEQGRKKS